MPINLSYPKRRSTMQLVIPVTRADAGDVKAWLPKDSVVSGIHILQTTDAVTNVGSFTVGLGSDADALLTAVTMATTKIGLVGANASAGSDVLVKQTSDRPITVTYTVGSSTAGGEGYVIIDFFMVGAGEAVTD